MPTRAQRAQSAAAAKVASPDPAAEADTGSPLSEAHTESHDGDKAAEAVEEPVKNEEAQEEVNEAAADEEMIKEDVKSDEVEGASQDEDAPVDEAKEDEAPTEDVSMNAAETAEKTTDPDTDAQGSANADAEVTADAGEENVSPGARPAQDGEDDDELMLNNQDEEPTAETEEAADDTPAPPAPRTAAPDRTLMDFLKILDTHAPIIPDAVTDYYLSQAGFECDDPRVKRLLALAAQKFVADIAQDAYQHSKIRSSGTGGAGAGAAAGLPGVPAAPKGSSRFGKDRGRAVLTMDDLGAAVQEYGIHIKRQDFMR